LEEREGPLASFDVPSIEDHVNVGKVGEDLAQSCIDQGITTRNEQEIPPHRQSPSWTQPNQGPSANQT